MAFNLPEYIFPVINPDNLEFVIIVQITWMVRLLSNSDALQTNGGCFGKDR